MSRDFDGVNDWVDLGTSHPITTKCNSASGITIATWVLVESYPSSGNERIITSAVGSADVGIFVALNNSTNLSVGGRSVTSDSFASQNILGPSINVWTRFAGVLDFGNSRIHHYMNGVVSTNAAPGWANTVYSISSRIATYREVIGCLNQSGTPAQFADCRLSYFQVFARALSFGEIDQCHFFPGSITRGMVFFAPMTSYSTVTEPDLSGFLTATSINGAIWNSSEPKVSGMFRIPKPELIGTP
jgi:hypothetical protein